MKSHLVEIMDEKKMTIRALEAESGISNVTILRARKDAKIGCCSLNTLAKIARALDVRVDDLFTDDPAEEGQAGTGPKR